MGLWPFGSFFRFLHFFFSSSFDLILTHIFLFTPLSFIADCYLQKFHSETALMGHINVCNGICLRIKRRLNHFEGIADLYKPLTGVLVNGPKYRSLNILRYWWYLVKVSFEFSFVSNYSDWPFHYLFELLAWVLNSRTNYKFPNTSILLCVLLRYNKSYPFNTMKVFQILLLIGLASVAHFLQFNT